MIKQIFGKKHRKKHPKKIGGGINRFSTAATVVVSAKKENFLQDQTNSSLSGNYLPSASSYQTLPSLKNVPSSDKEHLFIRKLKMCCVQFDFTDPAKDLKEKEIKQETLLELVEYTSCADGKFTGTAMQEAVHMVSANIFREFHPQPRENSRIDGGDLEDPAWPHLQIVYEFLLRFITSAETDPKVAIRYIDNSFVVKLLSLFDSENQREREYLKTILHRVYGKFMVHRPFIRKAIDNIFYDFVYRTEKYNGIAEFLEVLASIINGFALPLKEEHKFFLVRTLIPLHKPKCLAMYHQQLSYCMLQFVEKDCQLAEIVIRGLIKYWPVTNSLKEILFLNEVEEVLEMATQAVEFQRWMVPLFRQISRSLNSLHFQVAERALLLWKNEQIERMVKLNRKIILPIIFPSLEKNSRQHWNQAVHSLSLNARKIFQDLDPDLFQACRIKFQDNEAQENGLRESRDATWKRLEELATKNIPP